MLLLNNIPLVGTFFGVFVLLILLTNKSAFAQQKKARNILLAIVILNTYYQLDSFLFFNGFETEIWIGFSYTYYHLQGFLVYLFTRALFKPTIKLKPWIWLGVIYTLIRFLFIIQPFETGTKINEELAYTIWLPDYYLSLALNAGFLIMAFLLLRKTKDRVDLSSNQKLYFIWWRALLLVSIISSAAIIQSEIISNFTPISFSTQFKVESIISSTFIFAIAFLNIKFPVLSTLQLQQTETTQPQEKYAGSNLSNEKSNQIWNKLQQEISENKLYKNPEIRLADLAKELNESTHVLSQVINENAKKNFSDFINFYRVQESKELLLSEKAKTFTILALAYEVGFNSKSAFYSAFKKETGKTPSEFKKNKTHP